MNMLQEWGFKINKSDHCIANKTTKGRQCTILWHIDDFKILHAEHDVLEDILKQLTRKFGQDSLLTTNRGKVLDYLSMTIDYCHREKV